MAGSDWTDGLPSLPSPFGETHGEGSTTQQDGEQALLGMGLLVHRCMRLRTM
jgi:hypothetical protein